MKEQYQTERTVNKKNSGFTIIELMIVITFIGIVFTLVSSYSNWIYVNCGTNDVVIESYEACIEDDSCRMTAMDYRKLKRLVRDRENCLSRSKDETHNE